MLLLLIFFFGSASLKADNDVHISLEDFTRLALQKSLRSRINEDTLSASRWAWAATNRSLTWPKMDAQATQNTASNDTDQGTLTRSSIDQGILSLDQPFLTGTDVSLKSTVTSSYSDSQSSGVDTVAHLREYPRLDASLTQPLFLFVHNPSLQLKQQADFQWDMDQASYRREYLQIVYDAHQLYYNLLVAYEKLDIQKKKSDSAQLVNRATAALVRAGKLANVELTRATIRAQQDERAVNTAENDLRKAMNQALDLILLPSGTVLVPTSRLSHAPFTLSKEALWKTALQSNPDLLTSRWEVELQKISLQQTQEGTRPRLNLNGTYFKTLDRSNVDASIYPHGWTTTLGMDWPFFDASQTHLKTLQNQVALINAERHYQDQERTLHVTLENGYLDLKRAEEQILDFGPQRENAETTLHAIRLQYENGLTRLTDVFDAENELSDLEGEYLDLLVSFNTAKDQLSQLTGVDLATMEKGNGK